MKHLSIDIETYCTQDIGKTGLFRYAEDPSFELLLFAYAYDFGEVRVIDVACGEKIPDAVLADLKDEAVIKHAYNAAFERQPCYWVDALRSRRWLDCSENRFRRNGAATQYLAIPHLLNRPETAANPFPSLVIIGEEINADVGVHPAVDLRRIEDELQVGPNNLDRLIGPGVCREHEMSLALRSKFISGLSAAVAIPDWCWRLRGSLSIPVPFKSLLNGGLNGGVQGLYAHRIGFWQKDGGGVFRFGRAVPCIRLGQMNKRQSNVFQYYLRVFHGDHSPLLVKSSNRSATLGSRLIASLLSVSGARVGLPGDFTMWGPTRASNSFLPTIFSALAKVSGTRS